MENRQRREEKDWHLMWLKIRYKVEYCRTNTVKSQL
jgi:hypothetical protein